MAEESRRPALSKARLRKLHYACDVIRNVCDPSVAFAGDEEVPPESLSTEECNALLDTIEALQQVYSTGCPIA